MTLRDSSGLLLAAALAAVTGPARADWPKDLGAPAITSPRLVNLDGHPDDELIVITGDGRLHAISFLETELPGFPIDLPAALQAGTISAPPAIAQIEGDGNLEFVVVSEEGSLAVLRRDGSVVFEAVIPEGIQGAPVVTGTTWGPVVLVVGRDASLHLFRYNGTPWPGSPLTTPLTRVLAAPAMTDFDPDGFPEIVVVGEGTDGEVLALVFSLSSGGVGLIPEWPVELLPPGTAPALSDFPPPVVGDLKKGGLPEIAFVLPDGSATILDLAAVEVDELGAADGGVLPAADGFAPALLDSRGDGRLSVVRLRGDGLAAGDTALKIDPDPSAGVVVADLTFDESPEVIAVLDGGLVAAALDGVAPNDWPKPFEGEPLGPLAAGVQRTRIALALTTTDGRVHLWRTSGRPDSIQWDGFRHDAQHTGAFGTLLPERAGPGLGIDTPPVLATGCCSATAASFDALALAALLLCLRARRA